MSLRDDIAGARREAIAAGAGRVFNVSNELIAGFVAADQPDQFEHPLQRGSAQSATVRFDYDDAIALSTVLAEGVSFVDDAGFGYRIVRLLPMPDSHTIALHCEVTPPQPA